MSNLSLDKSLRTCKVSTGEVDRVQSDRFLNPVNMVCIPWNGVNNKGQPVCEDSWYTKTPGCRSAEDRVEVENALRPQYSDYINYNLAGLQGSIYGNITAQDDTRYAASYQDSRNFPNPKTGYGGAPSFGNQWQATNYPSCSGGSYERGMAEMNQCNRQANYASSAYKSSQSRCSGGF